MSLHNDAPALCRLYDRLETMYGAETWHWMPAHVEGAVDVIAGAVLVQHTTWTNAERALERLRDANALDISVLAQIPEQEIASLVRVSGTPAVKARRLRAVAHTVETAGGVDAFLALPAEDLRARLLATHGVGPETADAIALYAAGYPVFIVDAYTKRLFRRLGLGPHEGDGYDDWQRYLHDRFGEVNSEALQRFHAYIVLHGKKLCRAKPLCPKCPLVADCPAGQAISAAQLTGSRR